MNDDFKVNKLGLDAGEDEQISDLDNNEEIDPK
jgi:hypothetical protein